LKIQFYGYNTFLVESGDKLLAIDPGALFFYWFRFTTLIPESKWKDITHIFITHGDPDHYWHADRVAKASNAPVICNKTMLREVNGESLALGPRAKGVAFTRKTGSSLAIKHFAVARHVLRLPVQAFEFAISFSIGARA
jgi:glyoxylase-like metal-dependent hydrolase (beta-lactamase superfamily II)